MSTSRVNTDGLRGEGGRTDLDQKIQWALDHDEEARAIGLNGRDFSKKHLRKEDMECYLFRLLLEYANILEL